MTPALHGPVIRHIVRLTILLPLCQSTVRNKRFDAVMTWISVLPVLFRTPTTHSRAEADVLKNKSAGERHGGGARKRSFTTGKALAAESQEIGGVLRETWADIDPGAPFWGGG